LKIFLKSSPLSSIVGPYKQEIFFFIFFAIAVFPEPDSPVIQKRIPLFLLRINCFLILYFWSRDNIRHAYKNNLNSILLSILSSFLQLEQKQ